MQADSRGRLSLQHTNLVYAVNINLPHKYKKSRTLNEPTTFPKQKITVVQTVIFVLRCVMFAPTLRRESRRLYAHTGQVPKAPSPPGPPCQAADGLFWGNFYLLQSLRHGKPCHLPLHKGGSWKCEHSLFPKRKNHRCSDGDFVLRCGMFAPTYYVGAKL